ncbi:uncharacterized protein SPPG_06147 [Spizellomyces punctatus DAOM BR117]|uniref:Uncharacterized protein n=1 Tax=Spizellomyces punctatus (strain DAOM BR117) TaxID=645134 RepID=A0A0L0HB48_SPIPD|nr:uncharacterized protein SPPG_06147 [Spizellomyces punctatus DAOM BR117]KNC98442.1 hypothetical protein SPPG_06147 [Spizellomyces punctatus DAOM BR117]|eukprot:XP_016606482.1 hypothetical protein SPPG_06147 [Spizellomyces punctatus DAOM BR117]
MELPVEIIRLIALQSSPDVAARSRRCCRILWEVVSTLDLFKLKLAYLCRNPKKALSQAVRTSWPGFGKVVPEDEGFGKILRVNYCDPMRTHHADTHRDWVTEAVQILVRRGFVDNGFGALRAAAARGDLKLVRFLMQAAHPVVTTDVPVPITLTHQMRIRCMSQVSREFDPLVVAAANGNVSVVEEILKFQPLMRKAAEEALRAAVAQGHVNVVRILIMAGAETHLDQLHMRSRTPWEDDHTILQLAASLGHLRIIRELVATGSNPNDRTALREAVEAGHRVVVSELLGYGLKATLEILKIAVRFGHVEITEDLLRARGNRHGDLDAALRIAARYGQFDVVQSLIERGACVNLCGRNSKRQGSPLREAAIAGRADIVKALIKAGAQVDAQNNVALRLAAAKGHHETVQILLDTGKADVHAGAEYALSHAIGQGHTEVVSILLQHNADPSARGGKIIQTAKELRDPYRISQLLHMCVSTNSCNNLLAAPLILALLMISYEKRYQWAGW